MNYDEDLIYHWLKDIKSSDGQSSDGQPFGGTDNGDQAIPDRLSESVYPAPLNAAALPLSAWAVGSRVRIVSLNCGEANNRMMGMGLIPDAVLEVMGCSTTGAVIVALQDQRLGLGADMAEQIQVIEAAQPFGKDSYPNTPQTIAPQTIAMQNPPGISSLKLRDVAIGSSLKVVGYEATARDYKRKLLAMGLTPGTNLLVKRHAPLGDPTEIEVRGFRLSLRKDEADALIVEPA